MEKNLQETVSARLPPWMHRQLLRVCFLEKRTKSALVRLALADYLDRHAQTEQHK